MDDITEARIAVLEETKAVLLESGWCKHAFVNPDGEHCLIGAYGVANRKVSSQFGVASAISKALAADGRYETVFTFNDAPSTTLNDVLGFLDTTILIVKEEANDHR